MKLELWWPVRPAVVTQGWGSNGAWYQANNINIKGHNGFDLRATHGQPVWAAHDGVITYAGEDGSTGYIVVLRTHDKREYGNEEVYFKTIYGHLVKDIPVRAGQSVQVGDVIGYADNTGFSTGDHLHFGLKPVQQGEEDWHWFNLEQNNGYNGAIDPTPYMNGHIADEGSLQYQIIALSKQVLALLGLLKVSNNKPQ